MASRITTEHINIFKSYGGDIDGWARMNKPKEDIITEDIWFEIEGLIQNLEIIKNGFASQDFIAQTYQQMKSSCENKEAEQELIDLSYSR